MLFNLCAYWNETRGTVFKKKQKQFITVCYSTCVRIETKQEGQFSKKKHKFITVCYSTRVHIEMKQEGQFSKKSKTLIDDNMLLNSWTRGAVFKKQQFITVCYSTSVRIEMKQEGQFSKNNNLLLYAIQLVCVLKWNKRDSF